MSCVGEICPTRETQPELELSKLDAQLKDSSPGPATVGAAPTAGESAIAGGHAQALQAETASRNPVRVTGDTLRDYKTGSG